MTKDLQMVVWRVQLATDIRAPNDPNKISHDSTKIGELFIKNHIVAVGWAIKSNDKNLNFSTSDWDTYKNNYENIDKNAKLKVDGSVKRLATEIKTGDLIWMRVEGIYYIAKVLGDSKWEYIADKAETDLDINNQRKNIFWYKVGDEDSVPGKVCTAFIQGTAFRRIKGEGVKQFSQMKYNELCDDKANKFAPINASLNQDSFFEMLQSYDVEDLVALWLYKEKGYVCVPSTNKLSTQKYEYVLLDPKVKDKRIYVQVKNGTVDLDANDYDELAHGNNEVYLFTTKGKVLNIAGKTHIFKIDVDDIYTFAINPKNSNLIPNRIKSWIRYLSQCKGIMFDTNKSFSKDNEDEMFNGNYIAGYGDAQRYIKSFNKDDYVLYYSKGIGVIAIGKIKSTDQIDVTDGKALTVDLIVAPQKSCKSNKYIALSPAEIKDLLKHNYYFASTIKTPFLNEGEVNKLIDALREKQK